MRQPGPRRSWLPLEMIVENLTLEGGAPGLGRSRAPQSSPRFRKPPGHFQAPAAA